MANEVGTKEVVQGKTVQIAGPESLLNKIGKVVADVNVRGLDKSVRKTSRDFRFTIKMRRHYLTARWRGCRSRIRPECCFQTMK